MRFFKKPFSPSPICFLFYFFILSCPHRNSSRHQKITWQQHYWEQVGQLLLSSPSYRTVRYERTHGQPNCGPYFSFQMIHSLDRLSLPNIPPHFRSGLLPSIRIQHRFDGRFLYLCDRTRPLRYSCGHTPMRRFLFFSVIMQIRIHIWDHLASFGPLFADVRASFFGYKRSLPGEFSVSPQLLDVRWYVRQL